MSDTPSSTAPRDRSKSPEPRRRSRSRSRSPRRKALEAKLKHLEEKRDDAVSKLQEKVYKVSETIRALEDDQKKVRSDANKEISAIEEDLEPYKAMDMVKSMMQIAKNAPTTAFIFDADRESMFDYTDGPGADEFVIVSKHKSALVQEAARLLNANFRSAKASVYHTISASCSPCADDFAGSVEAYYDGEEVEFEGDDSKVAWTVDHNTAHTNDVEHLNSSDLLDHADIDSDSWRDFDGCGLDRMQCRKRVAVSEDTYRVLVPRR